MTGSSDMPRRKIGSTRAAAALAIMAGLAWALLTGEAAFRCALGCSGCKGSALPAAMPWIALCTLGIALWRRSPWALLLAPAPLALRAALLMAGWLFPQAFSQAACVTREAGIGLAFAVIVPAVGAVAVWHADATVLSRARELLPSRRALKRVAVMATVAALAALFVQRVSPLPMDGLFDEFSHSLPREDQVPAPDLVGRLQILNVRLSRLEYGGLRLLGSLLKRRLGPIAWMSHTIDADTRYVTATGHFPPPLWRPRYAALSLAFDRCLDGLRGEKNDAPFIQDWAGWWHGLMTAEEVNRRWGTSRPEVYLQEWSDMQRGALTPEEVSRRWASRAPRAELYNGLVRCAQDNPRVSEEAFSRVVFQWRCVMLQCRWLFIDPDAWARVSPLPCRTAGQQRCAAEAFDYLATGALALAPIPDPADRGAGPRP